MEGRIIYADNAATTKISALAYERMSEYLLDNYGNASQPYSFARNPKKALKEAREIVAACIGAHPEEIYFTSCGTESDNWVLSLFREKGITTTPIEHHAILNPCKFYSKLGTPVQYLNVERTGTVVMEDFKKLACPKGSLISVIYSNNEIGTIQDITHIAQIAHEKNCYFHTDAVQAVGHIEINVEEQNIDFLSASAHKFNGPKGIGFMYAKKSAPLHPLILGGSQESSMRAGTENIASIIAMATALKENVDALNNNKKHLLELESVLLGSLSSFNLDYVRNGSNHIPGNLSLSFNGANGEMLLHRLDLMGICVSTGSACDSLNTHVSHVLSSIGLPKEYAEGTIRISLSKDNTIDEVIHIASSINKILNF